MTKTERALALHGGGSACSQAVSTASAKDLGLDGRSAHKDVVEYVEGLLPPEM